MFSTLRLHMLLLGKLRRLTLGLTLITAVSIVYAKPDDITDAEMNLLPRYCPDTMGFKYGDAYSNTSPRASYWVSLMGNSFWAMHHYCWGLIDYNRSRKAGMSAQARKAILESVRGDFTYVIKNSTPDFIMLPEIYSRLGEVELLLSKPDRANEAFSKSRQLKPDYWPAYSHWAEFLMRTGRRSDALKVVGVGLAHSPRARVLLEQFRVLGGRPSDIPKLPEKPQKSTDTVSDDTLSKEKDSVVPQTESDEDR